jgi:hypothetical protein
VEFTVQESKSDELTAKLDERSGSTKNPTQEPFPTFLEIESKMLEEIVRRAGFSAANSDPSERLKPLKVIFITVSDASETTLT